MLANKVLIVDDEPLARARIRRYLEQHYSSWEIDEAADGVEALDKIQAQRPDLMFLDIEMPELTGFDVLRHLPVRDFAVIFQTAYDEFAVKAFDENACDYILKPFTDERLEQAIKKSGSSPGGGQLHKLDEVLQAAGQYLDKFVINVGARSKIIFEQEVQYFLSESHVTRLFLSDIDYAYDQSLSYLEKNLNPGLFVRLHRNSMVKISEIDAIERGQNTKVRLKNGTVLPVSRERKKQLMQLLKG